MGWWPFGNRAPAEPTTTRGFEAAERTRLNSEQHRRAKDETINQGLTRDLATLRKLTVHEALNNPFLAGVIETHVTDVVGKDGPSLQVQSDDATYNAALEETWHDWWIEGKPSLDGELSGAELLQQDIRLLWTMGSTLDQFTRDPDAATDEVTLRINPINPRRLQQPMAVNDPYVQCGVRLSPTTQKRISYFIQDWSDSEGVPSRVGNVKEYPADEIMHLFRRFEPGQVDGYPWAAPALQVIQDLRDFDAATLRAARMAAEMCVILSTADGRLNPIWVNEVVDLEGGVIRTAPPGYTPHQITPEHPSTNYKEHRAERLREFGRPVNMPLMMVMLDSAGHSYSSARFDGQIYNRGVQQLQGWITRGKMRRIYARVTVEAEKLRGVQRPEKVTTQWTWPVAPHVDPAKEAEAIEILLSLGLISEIEASAMFGRDYEQTCKLRERAAAIRKENGIEEPKADPDATKANKMKNAVKEMIGEKSQQQNIVRCAI